MLAKFGPHPKKTPLSAFDCVAPARPPLRPGCHVHTMHIREAVGRGDLEAASVLAEVMFDYNLVPRAASLAYWGDLTRVLVD